MRAWIGFVPGLHGGLQRFGLRSVVFRLANRKYCFPEPQTTRLLRHGNFPISEETIRETQLWGKTRFADGIVMAKTGHEAGRMAMHPYPAPIAGTRFTPRSWGRPIRRHRSENATGGWRASSISFYRNNGSCREPLSGTDGAAIAGGGAQRDADLPVTSTGVTNEDVSA